MPRFPFILVQMLTLTLTLLPQRGGAQALNVIDMECVGNRGFSVDDYYATEYYIYDGGGPSGNYCSNGHSTLRLFSPQGLELELQGHYSLAAGDTLYVYEDNQSQQNLRRVCTGTGVIYELFRRGVFLMFNTDDTSEAVGYELTLTRCMGTSRMIYDIEDSLAGGNVYLRWSDTSSREMWRVIYGRSPATMTDTLFTDTGSAVLHIQENGNIYYRIYNSDPGDVCDRGTDIRAICVELPGSTLCTYFTDLEDCSVTGYYGNVQNPYMSIGIQDYGDNMDSRITVVDDYMRRDPRTDNRLTMVPQGFTRSVRLGNWNTHGEAEAVVYDYYVDTALGDLLILHYAAVMQNPNHQYNEQPRFLFEIMDEDGRPVNPVCYSANFVSSDSLGWNSYYDGNADHVSVLWKNWTEVAVNMAPLQGRHIKIRLTTYDCVQGAHYGYAYFVFECASKVITSSGCADGATVFTAPAGLTYRWFHSGDPNGTLSTERTFAADRPGIYYCEMSSLQDTGGNCSFLMKAVCGARHIEAGMRTEVLDTLPCQVSMMFADTSHVLLDDGNTETGMTTELRQWIVDGEYRGEARCCFAVLDTGWHTVMLMVSIGGGRCVDTLVSEFRIFLDCAERTVVRAGICDDETYNFHGTLYGHAAIAYFDSADCHEQLILMHHYGDTTRITVTVRLEELPFCYQGRTYREPVSDTFFYQNRHGCDSLIILKLVMKNIGFRDTVVCDDAFPLLWHGVVFNPDAATLQQEKPELLDTVREQVHNAGGGDSLTLLRVRVKKNSCFVQRVVFCEGDSYIWPANGETYEHAASDTLRLGAVNGCDSLMVLLLTRTPAPSARIEAPGWTDLEHLMITLLDASGENRRQWYLPDGSMPTERQLNYLYPKDEDSVTIYLDVFADGGCYDRDTAVVHLDRHGLWIPNAITPGNATNRRFVVKGHGLLHLEVYIFARHGEELYHWQGLEGSWDATYKGEYVPEGAYVYLVRYSTLRHPRTIKERTGTVLVIY